MSADGEIFMTSRSRTPSLIEVTSICEDESTSAKEGLFAELPDIIQEAAVSTEFSSPNLRISRVQNPNLVTPTPTDFSLLTRPIFFISTRTDSGMSMPDLHLTDEKLLSKYGSDLTANFADIRTHGAKSFFSKQNDSTGDDYALCACATGYVWIRVLLRYQPRFPREWSDIEVQIGTFALRTRAITTASIPCRYKITYESDIEDGKLAILCSTVMAKYLRLRMLGSQYEDAAEIALRESRAELAAFRVVDPGKYGDMRSLFLQICAHAPMPPTSDVSLISRRMIRRRWEPWTTRAPRIRMAWTTRIARYFMGRNDDAVGILSGRLGRRVARGL